MHHTNDATGFDDALMPDHLIGIIYIAADPASDTDCQLKSYSGPTQTVRNGIVMLPITQHPIPAQHSIVSIE